MGNNKRTTFLANYRWQTVLKNYPPEIRLAVYDAMFEYAVTGEIPEMDKESMMAFFFIKAELDENQTRYEEQSEVNSRNGKNGGNPNFKKGQPNPYYKKITEDNRILPKITEITEDNPNDMICNDIISEKEKLSKESTKKVPEGLSSPAPKNSRKRFEKPTVEEIDAYCKERGNGIDAQGFFDYYESKGWIVGKSPMKDWKAAVRNWERMDRDTGFNKLRSPSPPREPTRPQKIITSMKDL